MSSALAASFRDPSGFVFTRDGELYRQVNESYREEYDHLVSSGLLAALVERGLMVGHAEVPPELAARPGAYRVLRPERIPFISYPYEWCFGELKDTALASLAVQRLALDHGMTLKDCSAYNLAFHSGRPTFIDTLSFERYQPGEPWVAYRQFCQHFLAPLALISYRDPTLGRLLRLHIDGIPLDLASRLLPLSSRLRPGLYLHLHLHAAMQRRYAGKPTPAAGRRGGMSLTALRGLLDSLEGAVRRLSWQPRGTQWGDYYDCTHNYDQAASEHKTALVTKYLERVRPRTVWDLGGNTGHYSRLASSRGIPTVSWDIDPGAIEQSYRQVVKDRETCLLPLLLDLTNPSPALGWAHRERSSLRERGPADLVLALALIHHLAISNNVPFPRIAQYLAELGRALVVEFVPKHDPQVQRLLASRRDVFTDYTQASFEQAFGAHFAIEQATRLHSSERTLYLMRSQQREGRDEN